jgi:hypothetical protein
MTNARHNAASRHPPVAQGATIRLLATRRFCPISSGVKHAFPLALLVALTGACHHDRDPEGPAERAGKHVDNAAAKTEKALDKAAQKTDAAAHKAVDATGRALEKTGDALERAGQKLGGSDAPPVSSSAPKSDK